MAVALRDFDVALFRRLRGIALPPVWLGRVRRFSALGEHGAGWIGLGSAAGVLDARRRRDWWRGAAGVGFAYACSTAIKVSIGRTRPAIEELPALMPTPTRLSFPSSHATSSFAAARLYAPPLAPARWPLYAAATGMALSRLLLGVHYPSDVVAGALLGTVLGGLLRGGRR